MKILGLDIEGKYGVMSPHEEGFYTTCCGLVSLKDYDVDTESIIWFDHNTHDRTPNGTACVQKAIDWADIVVGQNLKYDIKGLMHYGVNFDNAKVWDTMLAEWFISGQDRTRKLGLNALCDWYDVPGKGEGGEQVNSYWDRGVETADIPVEILSQYQINDCHIPIAVYRKQIEIAEREGMLKSVELQQEWMLALAEMEFNGIDFDYDIAMDLVAEYSKRAEEIAVYFCELLGQPDLKIGSDMQRSAVIFGGVLKTKRLEWTIRELKVRPESYYYEKEIKKEEDIRGLGFPTPTNKNKLNKNGYWKADIKTIQALEAKTEDQEEYKKLLLDYSHYNKIHSTLVGATYKTGLCRKLGVDGRVHPTLDQAWARTGRLTSKNPNGQNLFPAIKVCFIPTLDYIGQIDLSQVEWRTAGELSADEVMIQEVNAGVDQHAATATELMEVKFTHKGDPESKQNRQHAKIFNFRMIFGGTEWGFHLDVNMPKFGLKKWKSVIKKFWHKYCSLDAWHGANIRQVMQTGRLKTVTGKLYKFEKDFTDKDGDKTYSRNQIKNRPTQGTAAELMALLGVIIRRGMKARKMESKMILTVHDSIVFDIKRGEEDELKNLSLKVASSLREYIKAYFGIDWRTFLEGEFEIGPHYGKQIEVKLNQTCAKAYGEGLDEG